MTDIVANNAHHLRIQIANHAWSRMEVGEAFALQVDVIVALCRVIEKLERRIDDLELRSHYHASQDSSARY